MYFLQQIKNQFLNNIVAYQGNPEATGQLDNADTPIVQSDATPESVGAKAVDVNEAVDAEVADIEAIGVNDGNEKTPVSPETQTFIDASRGTETPDLSTPEAREAYKELGVEGVLDTVNVDALAAGEAPEEHLASSNEQLQGSLNEIDAERQRVSQELSQAAPGSPEATALEQKQSFLDGLFGSVDAIMNGTDIPGGGAIGMAQKYMDIHENSGEADKFLMGMAQSARTTPWCAGFVSFVCKEAGYENVTPTLSSRALIGQTGKGHVAFNVGNGQMLGGNQSNRVSVTPIKKEVEGWVMPEDAGNPDKTYTRTEGNTPADMAGKDAFDPANIPVGAIIVFKRNESQTNVR